MRIASPRTALDLGIGTVYQHPTLVPTLTVLENLMLGASWRAPMNRAATRARLNEIAALLGIALPEDTPLGALSLGQQQLVEIVKALWRGESVLILDEATSMLTPQGVEDLGRVIGRLRDAGIAVLFITHKLHEAVRFGDRVSVLRQGRKVGSLPRRPSASSARRRRSTTSSTSCSAQPRTERGRSGAAPAGRGRRASGR